ncbi:hypothetical protein [Roseimarinus sediminis]|uniref:hypothetical protein n=1 Tax=Roseimarinus sediminis TaxID=1610899 RepID=UPI003D1D766F
MIPSELKNLQTKILLLLLLTLNLQLPAQSDTLVVYEYQYVTDTVWLEPEMEQLMANAQSSLKLVASEHAMKPGISVSVKNENRSTDNLAPNVLPAEEEVDAKKSLLSKPLVSLSIGYSWAAVKPNPYGVTGMSLLNRYGIELRFPLHSDHWSFSAGIQSRGKPYSSTSSFTSSSLVDLDTMDTRIEYNVSFPFLLHYHSGKWILFGGIEFKRALLEEDYELMLPAYQWNESGWTLGFEYLIKPKFSLTVKAYSGSFAAANKRLSTNLYSSASHSLSLRFYLMPQGDHE